MAAFCVLALFVSLLDLSITNVALPSLALAFGASPSAIAWVAGTAFGLGPTTDAAAIERRQI